MIYCFDDFFGKLTFSVQFDLRTKWYCMQSIGTPLTGSLNTNEFHSDEHFILLFGPIIKFCKFLRFFRISTIQIWYFIVARKRDLLSFLFAVRFWTFTDSPIDHRFARNFSSQPTSFFFIVLWHTIPNHTAILRNQFKA